MKYVVYDFETASRCDLKKCGAWVYAQDFSTFVITLAIKVVEDGRPKPTRVLTEAELVKRDPEVMALAADPDIIWCAHNAGFEQGIWLHHMVPLGYPPLGPERHHDTMAVAAMKALPLGLDALGRALELPVRKDEEGSRLMLQLCRPDKHGGWGHHTPEALKRLGQYCGTDVDTQYAGHTVLGGLGPSERSTWILDQKINQRGLLIDREFVHACMDVLEQVRQPMTDRFARLTGLKPTQREKILDWVNAQGVPLADVKKATLDAILDPDDEFGIEDFGEPLPYHVHEVLTLRRALASSSVAKLERMLHCAGIDGRVRYSLQFHGTRTGRHAGRLIQIQNYPRGEISTRQGLTPEILADAIMTRSLNRVGELWIGDVAHRTDDIWKLEIFDAVISSLRSCIIPAKGKVLVGGDFSQIEAKLLLSTAGQHDKAQMIHAGVDAYAEMASMIYKRPINKKEHPLERQVGKNCVLGNGYGLGAVGFRARFIPKESIDLAMLAVNTYRKEFAPLVEKFWYKLFDASIQAVWCNEWRTYDHAGIEFRKEGDFLTMKLPSGRKLYYHRPRKEEVKGFDGVLRQGWSFMSYQGKKFRRRAAWHGQVTADCIQGTARDLLIHAVKSCEREGLNTVFTVHDEIVLEEPDRPGLDVMLKQIMEDIPPWARERKYLISAETATMGRYQK